jgi:hypothetical protein
MRKCDTCGISQAFTRFVEWRTDGTIVGTGRYRWPVALIESGEFEELLDEIANVIGLSVDIFIIQSQKDMGAAFFERLPIRHLKRVPARRLLRPQWLARMMMHLVGTNVAAFGVGKLELEHYRAGQSAVVRWKNCCLVPMLVGSAMGVYEVLEEMPSAEAEYSVEGDDLVINMRHAREKPEFESRLHLETVEPGTGPLAYKRCDKCDAPLLAAETFSWETERGIITNRKTGAREVLLSVPSVSIVFRELEKEIGEQLPELI